MSKSQSFWNHPIEKLEEALHIRRQIASLQDKLTTIFGDAEETPAAAKKRGGRRTMSPAARARIAAAQRARWAKTKRNQAPAAAVKAAAGPRKKKRRPMSAEARAKIATAAKARWALRKAASAGAK